MPRADVALAKSLNSAVLSHDRVVLDFDRDFDYRIGSGNRKSI
jgi:hypothetical protein